MPGHEPVKFILLLMPGFSLLSLGGFLDKLRFSGDDEDYSRQIACTWTLTSLSGAQVAASCGAILLPDCGINDLPVSQNTCDYLVIFGGNNPAKVILEAPLYRSVLRTIRSKNINLVSVDNAAFLLAACEIVKKSILVHWRHANEFAETFPSLTPVTDKNVYEEAKMVSCPGGNATIELATFLLEKKLGSTRAIKGLSDMLVAGFAPPSSLTWSHADLQHMPAAVRSAMIYMRKNINAHLSADDIAHHCGLSRRQLDRCLFSETGLTTHQFYSEMKFNYACWLMLRTTRTLAQIATDCGYTDTSHFSRHFGRRTGTTPARWRQNNRLP